MSKNNISFILHKPQLSENIGACVRAMKNFKSLNLSHSLIIIAQHISNLIFYEKLKITKSKKFRSASKKEIQSMTNLCIKHLDQINFFKIKIFHRSRACANIF